MTMAICATEIESTVAGVYAVSSVIGCAALDRVTESLLCAPPESTTVTCTVRGTVTYAAGTVRLTVVVDPETLGFVAVAVAVQGLAAVVDVMTPGATGRLAALANATAPRTATTVKAAARSRRDRFNCGSPPRRS